VFFHDHNDCKRIKKHKKTYLLPQWSDGDEDFSITKILENTFTKKIYAYEHMREITFGNLDNETISFVCNQDDDYVIIEDIKLQIIT
jgi:hypothetical protein